MTNAEKTRLLAERVMGWLVYRFFTARHAAKEGYTHYLPEPAPPAREVENDGE